MMPPRVLASGPKPCGGNYLTPFPTFRPSSFRSQCSQLFLEEYNDKKEKNTKGDAADHFQYKT